MSTLAPPAPRFEIDPRSQELFPLYETPSALPGRRRVPVNRRTVSRWAGEGYSLGDGTRVRLPWIRQGKERYTSAEALAWFMRQISRGGIGELSHH